ncbi:MULTISPECIES: hypothetical protein [Erwiniaceae]|uniref:Uncharacterized protein n=2 Tax=Erwiniaceae TaxID=1903409 RepID=A0ACC5RRP2_ENTAG|nr:MULTISPECIES: hypothetical protein [Erwiniaceae]MBK4727381.1 hypothetical protein [Pantoea agglomerans]MBP2156623.1 hypothetical protein [Erwinia rhapontici]MCS3607620.1 hypothetical protein [Erwinia rhapontici]NNS07575.1 hypothetical protein [Erwinia sp. JH02]TDT01927.1 hypothetical protein EDF84_101656 [Erwinia rhapontici]
MSYERRDAIYEQEQQIALQKAVDKLGQRMREVGEAVDAIKAVERKQATTQAESSPVR